MTTAAPPAAGVVRARAESGSASATTADIWRRWRVPLAIIALILIGGTVVALLQPAPAQGYLDTIERALVNPRLVATHTISNVLIEVAGDQAKSEHYVLALTRVKTDGVVRDSLVATRIVDDLVRRDERWLIARRRLRFDWAHDVGPRPEAWVSGTLDPAALLHSAKFPDDIVYE